MVPERSRESTDRVLFVIGAICMAAVAAWDGTLFTLGVIRLQVDSDVVVFLAVTGIIPDSAMAVLLLLVGWAIQRLRMRPPALFAVFVLVEILALGLGTVGGVLVYWSFRNGLSLLYFGSNLEGIAGIAHSVAVFLLVLLATPLRHSGAAMRPPFASAAGPRSSEGSASREPLEPVVRE
ncbi:MAG: hypothetical protein L3J78_02220 [Thermoplasmata archaeon]|nr:hypothetical protein [Thermoplasmata archaeon]